MNLKKALIIAFTTIFSTAVCHAQQITKQEKGYFNVTELGYQFGNNSLKIGNSSGGYGTYVNGTHALSLRTVNGIFITNKVSLGLGLGIENYSRNNGGINSNLFQLFGDVRYYFKNDVKTLFAYGQAGPSLKISDEFEKGSMYNVGIGYKFPVAERTMMNASFGLTDQYVKYDDESVLLQNRYYGAAFKVGVMF